MCKKFRHMFFTIIQNHAPKRNIAKFKNPFVLRDPLRSYLFMVVEISSEKNIASDLTP